jgi:hypothetical protein
MTQHVNEFEEEYDEFNDDYDDHFDLENFDEEYLNLEKIKEKHLMGRRRTRNARRSIEEYLELKRLERQNRDLFNRHMFDEH